MLVGILLSCSNKQNVEAGGDNIERTSHKIPYKLASNYFVKKNFDTSILSKSFIDNKNDFEAIFGIARTMSKNSEPTPIDFKNEISKSGLKTESGIFGADMKVSLLNDGPVTILMDSITKI